MQHNREVNCYTNKSSFEDDINLFNLECFYYEKQ